MTPAAYQTPVELAVQLNRLADDLADDHTALEQRIAALEQRYADLERRLADVEALLMAAPAAAQVHP